MAALIYCSGLWHVAVAHVQEAFPTSPPSFMHFIDTQWECTSSFVSTIDCKVVSYKKLLLCTASANILPSFMYDLAATTWAGARGTRGRDRYRWSQRFVTCRCNISMSIQTTSVYFSASSRHIPPFSSFAPRMLPLLHPVDNSSCSGAKRLNKVVLAAPQRLGTQGCPTELERKLTMLQGLWWVLKGGTAGPDDSEAYIKVQYGR